ncbi:MAG: acyl-CoA dehydrogenase family protein [Pirellulales bacterium]|nr:acyl-CoA dehydrogenase family protein [Pirellulales bacterium]
MDFDISPKMTELLGQLREFLQSDIMPLEKTVAEQGFRASQPQLQALRAKARERGFWLPQIDSEHGGLGLSLMEHGMVSEVLGRSPLGHYTCNCQAPDAGNMEILIQFGTPEQKQKFLNPLLRGEIRSCFSMTEPERPGSNPTWLDTQAVREGDQFVINGHKWFTSSADGASFAIVMAVTNPDAPPYERASQIIVPLDTPGFRFVRNVPIMGHAGDDYDSHAEVRYENCRVPVTNLLGGEGAGFLIAQERLGPGRIHHCMRWIGICERSFDLMCQRAATREVAPGKPLGTKEIVQAWIAESRAEIDAARLAVLHAAWKIDRQGLYQSRSEISCIKFFVADVMLKVIDRAIQVHGALGVTSDTPLAAFLRNERGARIYDGADEVHKVVVARQALKPYGLKLK